MGNRKRRIKRSVYLLAGAYLLYALLGNILPYLPAVPGSEGAKQQLEPQSLYSSDWGFGVDRAGLVESPEEAFGVRMALLGEAEETVDIVYHTVQAGVTTDAFLGEVLTAADRGVEVRILLDAKAGAMNRETAQKLRAMACHENITYRRYNPIHLLKPWEWEVLLHDKFMVVDGRYLLLGGRNLGDRYYAPPDYNGSITYDRDVLVWKTRDEGERDASVLAQAQDYMDLLWDSPNVRERRVGKLDQKRMDTLRQASVDFRAAYGDSYRMELAPYLDHTVPTQKISLLYNPIHTAKKEPWVAYQMALAALDADAAVRIQTPYATANRQMLEVLEQVRQTTANTSMLTNSLASSPNYPAFSNYYSQRHRFAETGFQLYEYQSSDSIHGKSMIVDDRLSFVGSLNMDDRSFFIDTETMLAIDSMEFAAVLTGAMDSLQKQSLLVNAQGDGYEPGQEMPPEPAGNGKVIGMKVVSVFSRMVQFLI